MIQKLSPGLLGKLTSSPSFHELFLEAAWQGLLEQYGSSPRTSHDLEKGGGTEPSQGMTRGAWEKQRPPEIRRQRDKRHCRVCTQCAGPGLSTVYSFLQEHELEAALASGNVLVISSKWPPACRLTAAAENDSLALLPTLSSQTCISGLSSPARLQVPSWFRRAWPLTQKFLF